jgi:hypothetical protein
VTSSPAGINCVWPPACTSTATYVNNTTVTLAVATAGLTVIWGGACAGAVGTVCTVNMDADKTVTLDTLRLFTAGSKQASKPVGLASRLEVPDGEGQVVMNGSASAARAGLSMIASGTRAGAQRVEGLLVRGSGRPGPWRFDLGGHGSFKLGSLRVLAGTVALVAGDSVVFQLQGRPGERIAFTFEIDE